MFINTYKSDISFVNEMVVFIQDYDKAIRNKNVYKKFLVPDLSIYCITYEGPNEIDIDFTHRKFDFLSFEISDLSTELLSDTETLFKKLVDKYEVYKPHMYGDVYFYCKDIRYGVKIETDPYTREITYKKYKEPFDTSTPSKSSQPKKQNTPSTLVAHTKMEIDLNVFCESCGTQINIKMDDVCPNCGKSYDRNPQMKKIIQAKEEILNQQIEEIKDNDKNKKSIKRFFFGK